MNAGVKYTLGSSNAVGYNIASSSGTININRNTVIALGSSFTTTGTTTFQNSAGANLLIADAKNSKVGINTIPNGTASLQVGGDIQASGSLIANSGTTSISNNGLKINNVTVCTSAGCELNTSSMANVTLQGNIFNGAGQLVQLTSGGVLPALSGINLTNLDASNISQGTLADNRLSSNVALKNGNNKFTGTALFVVVFQAFYR